MSDASKNGHLEVVKFLYYNRTEGDDEDALINAIENSYFEIVNFFVPETIITIDDDERDEE